MKKIQPVPEALIQCWEDYSFVLLDTALPTKDVRDLPREPIKQYPENEYLAPSLSTIYALHSRMTGQVQAILTACRELLSQSPDLVRIFHAGRLLTPDLKYEPEDFSGQLFRTHIVLDLSWDDILGCIRSLRPLIPHESGFFYTVVLFMPALCHELDHLYPAAMVSRDLACGFLRLMQQIGRGERPGALW
jgi:hypothetical protein